MKQKQKRVHKTYELVSTFTGENATQLAVEAIAAEKFLSYHYKNDSDKGTRVNYRCNLVTFRGTQCAAGSYLSYDSQSSDVRIYRCTDEHTHANLRNAVIKISSEAKDLIREMYNNDHNIKPSAILYNLSKANHVLPSKSQLASFMKELRLVHFPPVISLGALEKWLSENTDIPTEKSAPFIVDYDVLINENKPNDSEFRFMVSTKRLLENAINIDKIHTDATYKLVWQGFPVLLVGTSDTHRQFHMIGIAVCTSETSVDFGFIFDAVNKGLNDVFNCKINPKHLICDAADSILNGFFNTYGQDHKIVIMCWAHMRRAVSKKILTYFRDARLQNDVLYDIDKLQLCRTDEDFDKAAILFIEKWEKHSSDFTKYFHDEWLVQHRFWYEGAALKIPSTNNCQEATHKVIKDKHTIRARYDLSRFREVLFRMLHQYSTEYIDGTREIHYKPDIDLPMWTKAYNWAKSNVDIKVTKLRNRIDHEIPVTPDANTNDSLMWQSFNNFRRMYFSKCTTSFMTPFNKTTWDQGICNCSDFFKLNVCQHVVGIALRMKFAEAPPEAKTIPIGQKRKRGRPALAKSAFVIQ